MRQQAEEVKRQAVMVSRFSDVKSFEERVNAMTFTEYKRGREVTSKAKVLNSVQLKYYKRMQ